MLREEIKLSSKTNFHPGVELDLIVWIFVRVELFDDLLGCPQVEGVLDVEHVLLDDFERGFADRVAGLRGHLERSSNDINVKRLNPLCINRGFFGDIN